MTARQGDLFAFLRGFTIWRVQWFGRRFAVNATRWFYLSNHAYPGERRWYVRIGKRPGWRLHFGSVIRG